MRIVFLLIITLLLSTSCSQREIIKKNITIPMSDGIGLSANLTLPDKNGKWPVVIVRTPYGNDNEEDDEGEYWASNGYAFVIQDCRGTNKSEGEWEPGAYEKKDGSETHNWILKQPWCDGNIVTTGGSYLGFTQFAVAPYSKKNFKAMVTIIPLIDWYKTSYIGGAFTLGTSFLWGSEMNSPKNGEGFGIDWESWNIDEAFKKLPLINWDENIGREIKFMRDWIKNPTYNKYWQRMRVLDDIDSSFIPNITISGWYDIFIDQAIDHQSASQKLSIKNQHLIIGPWGHGPGDEFGELKYKNHEKIDIGDIQLKWFDHWTRNINNGIEKTSPVMIYVMGGNFWREENEFPLERTKYSKYYFNSSGNANSLSGDGTLNLKMPEGEETDSYTYDPQNPVPTKGGAILFYEAGSFDQTEIEIREDVLIYTSGKLKEDIEITGPVKVILYASSDSRDTDFTAKLVDVNEMGKSYNLCDGIIRARYNENRMIENLIEPGKIIMYEIDLWHTSNIFLKGHKLRVEISSSNFPRFDRNPNTGNKFGMDNEIKIANQTIYHSKEYPSHILLPIIPN